MIDAASGGALGDMTPNAARNLIEKMSSNSQQFSARGTSDAIVLKGVNDMGTDPVVQKKLEGKIEALTSLVTQLAINQKSSPLVAKLCGICSSNDHYSDLCPTLQASGAQEQQPEAYIANIYNNKPQ